MYPARAARELGVLLRISREIDIVGDVTAIVDNPSELIAWAYTLEQANVIAWRATDSGFRYLQVSALHEHEPIRGRAAAVLHCENHSEFWRELTGARDLEPGDTKEFTLHDMSRAWEAMPITAPRQP